MHPTTIVATANRLAENETVFNIKIDKTVKAKALIAAKRLNSDLSKEVRKAIEALVAVHEDKHGEIKLPE
jgi:hypothetical protein